MTISWRRLLLPTLAVHGLALLGLIAWLVGRGARGSLPLVVLTLGTAGMLGAAIIRAAREYRRSVEERGELAQQLDRRISEIFSLQEMSYVVAESLQTERIAEQVARYAIRFLVSEGAAVALTDLGGQQLTVVAAEGTLRDLVGQPVAQGSPALVLRAMTRERIEVGYASATEPLEALPGRRVRSAAAAPLRAHGLPLGAIVVADRRQGSYSPEDFWLLSTLATHVSVVLANSRLFELVRQAKEEWETAFNALTTGIAVLDGAGRISRANRALARLLEAPQPAVIGLPFWPSVVGAEDGASEVLEAARRGTRPAPVTVRSSARDRILRLTAAPLGEPGGGNAVVVLVEDVTEQRSLETQLIQSEKLAAVGLLVSGVAHELNNPLASIGGLAEFLQERPGIPEAEREHLRVIQEQAQRAERIVRNLLTFARKSSPRMGVVDLNELVERTALLVTHELRLRGVEFVRERCPGVLAVRGRGDELQQVLLNLITNALQALQSLPAGRPRRIQLVTERGDGEARVRVRDSGPGVPSALVPQLFTPFFTTKEPGEGTGLGLSISYGIMQSHGGRLTYAEAPGGGAEFSFSLPLAETGPASRSVLVALADQDASRTVGALFEPAGYAVERSPGGRDALARLRERRFDVVVTDLAAADEGATPLAVQLLEDPALCPPHLLVATEEEAARSRLTAAGARVLPHPFRPRDLVEVAGDLLGRAVPAPAGHPGTAGQG